MSAAPGTVIPAARNLSQNTKENYLIAHESALFAPVEQLRVKFQGAQNLESLGQDLWNFVEAPKAKIRAKLFDQTWKAKEPLQIRTLKENIERSSQTNLNTHEKVTFGEDEDAAIRGIVSGSKLVRKEDDESKILCVQPRRIRMERCDRGIN
jgi:hypothetical protein